MARQQSVRFRSVWFLVALGLDPRARTTPKQSSSPRTCTASPRMGVQAVRKMQLLGPRNVQALRTTATGGRHRDRRRLGRALAWHAASTEARTTQQRSHSERKRLGRPSGTLESRSRTHRCTRSRPSAEFHQRARAGGSKARRKEREQQKKQLVHGWTQPPQQQDAPRQPGRKLARSTRKRRRALPRQLDVLVNALETEKTLREQARNECTKEDNETELQDDGSGTPRGTPQRARQCGEGMVSRSPDHSRASGSRVRSKSHAATHSDKDKQQHAREARSRGTG